MAEFVGAEVLVNEGSGWTSCGVGRVMWQQADGGTQRLIVVGPGESVLASADLPDKAVQFSLSAGTVLHILPIDAAEWALSFTTADDAAQVWEDVQMLNGGTGGASTPPGSPMGIEEGTISLPTELPLPTVEGLDELESLLFLLDSVAPEDPARGALIEALVSPAPVVEIGGRSCDYIGALAVAYEAHATAVEVAAVAAMDAGRAGATARTAVGYDDELGTMDGTPANGSPTPDPPVDPVLSASSARFGRLAKLLLTLEEGSVLRRVLRDDAAPFLFGALEYEARTGRSHLETKHVNTVRATLLKSRRL